MTDSDLRKVLSINAASAGGHIRLADAFADREPTEADQQQAISVLNAMLSEGVAKRTNGAWYLTATADVDRMIRTIPEAVDFTTAAIAREIK